MNIAYLVEKIKAHRDGLTLALIIALTALFAFGLGRWSQLAAARPPITIDNAPAITSIVDTVTSDPTSPLVKNSANPTRNFLASKNGSRYYPLGCKAGERIKVENRIFFASAAEAEGAGYERAATCP